MARTYTLIAAEHAAGVGRRADVHELGEPGSPLSEDILPRTARAWIAAQRSDGEVETLIYVAPGAVGDEDHPTLTVGPAPATPPDPDPDEDVRRDVLHDEMTEILGAYQRHQIEAASLAHAALIRPGDLDEDGEPYPQDPISPAEYQAAAAVHAQLALAAATALSALTTLRASRAGQAS